MDQHKVGYKWNAIPWRKLDKLVFKLQKRIYQAEKCNDIKKVHKLQRLLLNSRSPKMLAVRRVTQDNRGKKTAGIDGKENLNQKERIQLAYSLDIREKAKPSRRIWIPKPGNKNEQRPLSIPIISDRAKETLMKMALEPEWEAKFEPNTYGFRPGRSCHDAIEAIFSALKGKTAYILDADISGCFDNIDHNSLLTKLNTTPTFRKIIKGWLKAGVVENGVFKSTEHGTRQGGNLSPLLANVALYGIEGHIKGTLEGELFQFMKKKYGKASYRQSQQSLSVIFYADDFVVIHESEEIIFKAKNLIEKWLKAIGLELKPSKTRISHTLNGTQPGFNFLGFFIRHYPGKQNRKRYKLLIKPSQDSRKQHTLEIKHKIKKMLGLTQEAVIQTLNPIIRGWSQYYSSAVSSKTFNRLNYLMYRKLWRWAVYRHPNKGKQWIKKQYFKKYGNDNWQFKASNNAYLIRHSDQAIKRHVKVQDTRSLYDGDWVYWGNRLRKIPDKSPRVIRLLKLQQGKCDNCRLWFKSEDIVEIHHKDQNRRNNMINNLAMLHGHCHDELHRKCA